MEEREDVLNIERLLKAFPGGQHGLDDFRKKYSNLVTTSNIAKDESEESEIDFSALKQVRPNTEDTEDRRSSMELQLGLFLFSSFKYTCSTPIKCK
jgi:hypothetical protein